MKYAQSEISYRNEKCTFYPGEVGVMLTCDIIFSLLSGVIMRVPAGFWYNGASIPAYLWQAIYPPFDPRIIIAAAIHDWLYSSHVTSREEADQLLYLIALENGADADKCDLIKKAVRTFGGKYWEDSANDVAYFKNLKNFIVNSGRDLSTYGVR